MQYATMEFREIPNRQGLPSQAENTNLDQVTDLILFQDNSHQSHHGKNVNQEIPICSL